MRRVKLLVRVGLLVALSMLVVACSTGFHGSFVEHTYRGDTSDLHRPAKGLASGSSCQTRALYVFPTGEPPSTRAALDAAKAYYPGTAYLTDVSVENTTDWAFGYARACTTVTGTAR